MSDQPAFPCKIRETWQTAAMRRPQGQNLINPQPVVREEIDHPGMTLRDYFAGKAMEKAMTEVDSWITKREQERLAFLAYEIADAMLKARDA